MARGRTYNKTYADVRMKEDIIREVGSFLEELIVKDIAPLKMIKKDFPITNPPIRDLRDFAPSVSYETIREFCYIIGYEPTLKSKACLKCLYFTKIISALCCYLEYFSYLYTIN